MKNLYLKLYSVAQICVLLLLFLVEVDFHHRLYDILYLFLLTLDIDILDTIFGGLIIVTYCLLWSFIASFLYCTIFKKDKKEVFSGLLSWKKFKSYNFPQKLLFTELVLSILFVIAYFVSDIIWGMGYVKKEIHLLYLIIGTVIALFWYISDKIWKTKRYLALITIIPAACTLLFYFYALYMYIDDRRVHHFDKYEPSAVVDDEDYDYDYEYEQDNVYEWEGPDKSDKFTDNAFSEFAKKNKGYYFLNNIFQLEDPDYIDFSEEVNKNSVFINNIALFIARDNYKLLAFYNKYRDILLNYVSYKDYMEYYHQSVSDLLYAHVVLNGNDNFYEVLNEIYRKMNRQMLSNDEMYEILENYGLEVSEEDDEYEYADMVWAYSFWARRNKENNEDAVINILRDISYHYSNFQDDDSDEGDE